VEPPNPFGFTVDIRTPLLSVINDLKKHVAQSDVAGQAFQPERQTRMQYVST